MVVEARAGVVTAVEVRVALGMVDGMAAAEIEVNATVVVMAGAMMEVESMVEELAMERRAAEEQVPQEVMQAGPEAAVPLVSEAATMEQVGVMMVE
eukprot:5569311-Prymnesium_polylepis.1